MRKFLRWFYCSALLLIANVAALAGVSVTSPVAGSTDTSPVHFAASAKSTYPVTYMMIYVDNKAAYGIAAASLSTNLSMATGAHYVVVQAWDSSGAVSKAAVNITVSSSAPVIPSNATVFSQIEDMTGWQSCDACAGAGGSGTTDPHWQAQFQTTPSLDGSSSEFYLGGTAPYSAALWWEQLGPIDTATHFVYDLYYRLSSETASQALEFDVNQSVGGNKYIFGTECDFTGLKHWRVWDYFLHWQDTGVSCVNAQSAGVWHHLVWEFERTTDGHTHFIAVTVDGARQSINRYYHPKPISVRELNVAFQMEGKDPMVPYYAWLDKVKLSVW